MKAQYFTILFACVLGASLQAQDIGTRLFSKSIEIQVSPQDLNLTNRETDIAKVDLMTLLARTGQLPQGNFKITMIYLQYQVGRGHPSFNIVTAPFEGAERSTTVVPVENRRSSFGNLYRGENYDQLDFIELIDPRPSRVAELLLIGQSQLRLTKVTVLLLNMGRYEVERAMAEYSRNSGGSNSDIIDLSRDNSQEPVFIAQNGEGQVPPRVTPPEMNQPSAVVTPPPQQSSTTPPSSSSLSRERVMLRSCENRTVQVAVRVGDRIWFRDFDGVTRATELKNVNVRSRVAFVASRAYQSDTWVQTHRLCVRIAR